MHSFRRYYRGRVKKFQTKLLYVAFRCSHTTAGMKWIDEDDDDIDDDDDDDDDDIDDIDDHDDHDDHDDDDDDDDVVLN